MPVPPATEADPAPLRLAAVGAGSGRGRFGAALLASGEFKPVALVDTDAKAAKAWARELKVADTEIFGTLASFFASETRVEAAAVSLPPSLRSKVVRALAQRKIAPFVETPLGETLADTDAALTACREADTQLFPLLSRRFDPFVDEITRLLAENALGTVQHIRCDWTLPIAESTVHELNAETGWHAALQEAALHSADLCRLWLGDAFTVSADLDLRRDRNLPQKQTGRRRAEVVATMIVNHDRGLATHHLARVHGAQAGERYTLTGTGGEIQWVSRAGIRQSAGAAPSLTLTRNGQRTEPLEIETYGMPLAVLRTASLLDHAAAVLRGGAEARITGQDARAALEIVHAAYSASYESVKVRLPLKQSPDIASMLRDPGDPLQIGS